MEDVLEVYHRPRDEERPVVCIDEASRQLIGETVEPMPAEPGQPERIDYEYVRNGVANAVHGVHAAAGPAGACG